MISNERLEELAEKLKDPTEIREIIQELLELRNKYVKNEKTWRIIVPGYEPSDNGADWHPDDFLSVTLDKEDLDKYILEKETEFQIGVLVENMNPYWRLKATEPALNINIWKNLDRYLNKYARGCKEWCRGVEEVIPDSYSKFDLDRIIEKAKVLAREKLQNIISEESLKIEKEKQRIESLQQEEERNLLKKLQEKYGKDI